MSSSGTCFLPAQAVGFRVQCLAVLTMLVAGCSIFPPAAMEEAPQPTKPPSETVAETAHEFAVPASMLDTWNAVGQVLVRLDGVTYEGRAQMLGLYAVQYRGERFLIVTRARVLHSQADEELTVVSAVLQNGKPNRSAPAVELLRRLELQLPAELTLIAAGGR